LIHVTYRYKTENSPWIYEVNEEFQDEKHFMIMIAMGIQDRHWIVVEQIQIKIINSYNYEWIISHGWGH